MCKETLIIAIIDVIYFNSIHLLPMIINFSNVCLGPLPFFFVYKDLRQLTFAMIVTLYPLSICEKTHLPLPPSLVLEDLQFVLLEEKYFLVFYKFLQSLEEKAKENLDKYEEPNFRIYSFSILFFNIILFQVANI